VDFFRVEIGPIAVTAERQVPDDKGRIRRRRAAIDGAPARSREFEDVGAPVEQC
jgi:hypothetical protein